VVQAAVTARAIAGQSKRKIARDLKIARNTVTGILAESELNQLVQEGKTGVYSLIPLAVNTYRYHLGKKSHPVATRVLEGTGVLETQRDHPTQEQSIKVVILDSLMRPPRVAPTNGELPANGNGNA